MHSFTTLEEAFTVTLMDLDALRRTDVDLPELHHHSREIDFALSRLCEALEEPADDPRDLAHLAHRAVSRLAQLLESAGSDDRRTREKLDLARGAIAALLDELERLHRASRGA